MDELHEAHVDAYISHVILKAINAHLREIDFSECVYLRRPMFQELLNG